MIDMPLNQTKSLNYEIPKKKMVFCCFSNSVQFIVVNTCQSHL